MRVFLLGADSERTLGFAIGQGLLSADHSVAALMRPGASGSECGVEWVDGQLGDASVLRELEKADAVIDADLALGLGFERTETEDRRPSLLARLLSGTGKPLVMTSSAAILGDTGPVPLSENAALRTPPNHAYLARLERDVLRAKDLRGIVIRPAIQHGLFAGFSAIDGWVGLARRRGCGTWIDSGTNCWSAVHRSDLAGLYVLALQKAPAGTVFHAASETFSMRQLAGAIQQRLGLAGEASGISMEEASRLTPVAAALCQNRAISGDRAIKELGWRPVGPTLLQEVSDSEPASRIFRRSRSSRHNG